MERLSSQRNLSTTGLQVKEVDEMKGLEKIFKFKNFASVLEFSNKIRAIAEEGRYSLGITEYGWVAIGGRVKLTGFTKA